MNAKKIELSDPYAFEVGDSIRFGKCTGTVTAREEGALWVVWETHRVWPYVVAAALAVVACAAADVGCTAMKWHAFGP